MKLTMDQEFERERRFPRYLRACRVLYAGPNGAGTAELCDISRGGLGVRQLSNQLAPGACVPVTFAVGLNRVGPFAAHVVWSHEDRAGLELDHDDPAVECRVAQAMRYLEPR